MSEETIPQTWKETVSAEDFVRHYPERAQALLEALDLGLPELDAARSAVERGDLAEACRALLRHYREGDSAQWLRLPAPDPGEGRSRRADPMLDDVFTFQGVAGQAPRTETGGLDWHHQGPHNDFEWAVFFNRHSALRQLLQAWQETGNAEYAAAFDQIMRDWCVHNPAPEERVSNASWRALEAGMRMGESWPRLFYGFLQAEGFSEAARLLMLAALPDHGEYLVAFHSRRHNHATMQMNGLGTLALAFPEFRKSENWFRHAADVMTDEIRWQFYPDGVHKELTAHYHNVALSRFAAFAETCRHAGRELPGDYGEWLERTMDYVARAMRPDGHGPLNNNSDLDYNTPRIRRAAEQFDRSDWLYIATNGQEGQRPEGLPSAFYPWAGQLISRSGWEREAHWSYFDIGPWGTAHQHNDHGHLSVAAYGRDLLVDTGRFAYRGELARRLGGFTYARDSLAHNVVLIDGQGQGAGPRATDEPLPESQYALTEVRDFARGSFDRFDDIEGTAEHTRAVVYLHGKAWLVVDRIETDRPRVLSPLWHFHPDCAAEIQGADAVTTDAGKGNLRVVPIGDIAWEARLVKGQEIPHPQGWYSRRYNEAVPAYCAVYEGRVEGDATFAWLLLPAKGTPPAASGSILSARPDEVVVRLELPGETLELSVPMAGDAPLGEE